jgi:ADP-heptose:LPS heptosyltransferase
LLNSNPSIDRVIELEDNLNSTTKFLKNEQYDYLIDLHNNIRTKRIKNALSLADFTVDKLNIKKWLLVNLKINKLPDVHIVDRYLDTLSVFDVKNDGKTLDYFIPEKDNYILQDSQFQNGFVAFVLGATYFTKQIPHQLVVDIINRSNLPFVLLGGVDDVEKSKAIEKELTSPIVSLCGEINLNQSASVIKQSKLVVSSDTGLMHIASAFNKPIISLWGNTVPDFGMSPYLPNKYSKIFENSDLKCRPCSKIGFNKCPKKHFKCMLDLDPVEISSYIKEVYVKE